MVSVQIHMTMTPHPFHDDLEYNLNLSYDNEPSKQHPCVTSLGDLIASIPGVLGFYPQESAMIITLEHEPGTDGAYLGPVLRADLTQTEQIVELAATFDQERVAAHLGVVVSRIPNSDLVRDAVRIMAAAEDEEGLPLVDACWHVSEIATGTPYSQLFGPEEAEARAQGLGGEWLTGTVTSVVTQPTMAPLLAQGALPELTRDDTRSFFEAAFDHEYVASYEAVTRAYRRGEQWSRGLAARPAWAAGEMERACAVLRASTALPIVGADTRPGVDDVAGGVEGIERLAAVLAFSRSRDCLMLTALDCPEEAAAALITVARSFDGVIRANALSLWAVIAMKFNLHSWATAALSCAQDTVPGHSLSSVLGQLLCEGKHQQALACARQGGEEVWENLKR